MNKSQLISVLSDETNFSKKDIARVLSAMTNIIQENLRAGEKVSITGFGNFWVSRRPERVGINPATKERITLPAVNIPRFKPGKALKENIRSSQ
ncbi:MAG: HU family DNA-binding protein [Candidatus Dependentiae bacterium]|jgi:DNA-binding protein HU-beta